MKRTIFYLVSMLITAFTLSSCGSGISPSKNKITKKYNVEAFNKIECSATLNLVFTQGNQTVVEAYGPDNIIPNLIVSIQDSTLNISVKEGFKYKNFKGGSHTTFTVSSPELCSIRQRGAGNITLKDSIQVDNLEIKSYGAGNFKIENLTANNISVRSEGVGNVVLKGKANSADYHIEGVGNLNAKEMIVSDVVAEQNGIGNVSCYASETITARTHGIGNIDYYGNPAVKRTSKNGIGSINQK